MSEELKACYHCGEVPKREGFERELAVHQCSAQSGNWIIVPVDIWQTRPLEDALIAERDFYKEDAKASRSALEKIILERNDLRNKMWELENAWFIDESIQSDGSLRPSIIDTIDRMKKIEEFRDTMAKEIYELQNDKDVLQKKINELEQQTIQYHHKKEDALIAERDLLRQQLDVAMKALNNISTGYESHAVAYELMAQEAIESISKLGEKK